MLWPILVFACFPAEATEWFKSWISISLAALSPLPADEYLWLLKNISWLTFPLWPLALWGIYAWRDQIRQAPLIIPLSFSVVALCSVIFTGTELYSTLLFLVPSLSVLAALGVVSLKHSRKNFLDLYSGIIYTLAVIAVWVYFFAWTLGVPAKMAFSITRLAPDVEPHGTSVFLFLLAVIATLLWIAIVFWRLFKHPVFSWRGAWMAGTGLTAVWIIVMSLFVNLIDGARSMKPIVDNFKAVAVENKIPLDKIGASHLTLSNIAAFNYWGGVNFDKQADAPWILRAVDRDYDENTLDLRYEVVDVFQGRPRSSEKFLLIRRK